MALLDRFLGRDEGDESDGGSGGDEELLFDEEGEEDLDDFGGDEGFDDDLGFDEADGGDASTAELEGRVDELENEVASLSSTVSTIRSENEEISNTVGDVEENVRKLLDIYEMVTRGVNPFVDDVQGGMGGGADLGDGSLGLFDDDGDEEAEDLDDSVADADAEDFFDDDFLDEDDDPLGEDDEFGSGNGSATMDTETTEDTMADDSDDSGKSFEELKSEYESGDADWAGGEPTNGESDAFDGEETPDVEIDGTTADAVDGAIDEGFDDEGMDGTFDDEGMDGTFDDEGMDGTFDDEGMDDGFDDSTGEGGDVGALADDAAATTTEPGDAAATTAEPDDAAATAADEADETDAADTDAADGDTASDLQFAANTLSGEAPEAAKPYLDRVPAGYVSDLLVIEWLEFLVDASSVDDAARAVEYYRRVQWLGDDAADELRQYLAGFGDVDADATGPPTDLSVDHHITSLRYVSRLTGSGVDSMVFDCLGGRGGGRRGL